MSRLAAFVLLPALAVPLLLLAAGCKSEQGALAPAGAAPGPSAAELQLETVLRVVFGATPDVDLAAFLGRLPEGFPEAFPLYGTASPTSGFRVNTETGLLLFAVFAVRGDVEEVFSFFEEALPEHGWEVVGASRARDIQQIQFEDAENSNTNGTILLGSFAAGLPTTLAISLFLEGVGEPPLAEEFELGESLPLPQGYPDRVPLYANSTVLSSDWAEGDGVINFQVRFITTDEIEPIIDFYEEELPLQGWTVVNVDDRVSRVDLTFEDQADPSLGGLVSTGPFLPDTTYTEVTVQFAVIQEP